MNPIRDRFDLAANLYAFVIAIAVTAGAVMGVWAGIDALRPDPPPVRPFGDNLVGPDPIELPTTTTAPERYVIDDFGQLREIDPRTGGVTPAPRRTSSAATPSFCDYHPTATCEED